MIEEVFVIGSNGLLVKHMSRTLMTDKDRDVVGSMISAISSFVREAFSERDGEVHEVSLGDHRFVMCNEAGLVVAVLVTAGETEAIVHRLRHLLTVLRDRYGERLAQWQGEPIDGIEDDLGVLWHPYHLPPPPVACGTHRLRSDGSGPDIYGSEASDRGPHAGRRGASRRSSPLP